jgi:hypothetical protein
MVYKLLGIVVWKVAKSLLRYRYGSLTAPKSLLAGGAVIALVGALLAARSRGGDD